jgi:hypothetical protein
VFASCIAAVAAIAVYAEFVLDFRTPGSGLSEVHALGASASLQMSGYNEKVAHYRGAYGDRAHVILDPSNGRLTVTLDGATVEEGQILREFGGMYGMFVVIRHDGSDSIFPFAIEPGAVPQDHEPNIGRLKNRFESSLPAQYLDLRTMTGPATIARHCQLQMLDLVGLRICCTSGQIHRVSFAGRTASRC